MKTFTVRVSEFAFSDLEIGSSFYDRQEKGLGDYFYDALIADIESLQWYGGIHPHTDHLYKAQSKRFPYNIYYTVENTKICIVAVLDQRQEPMHNYTLLGKRTRDA